MAGLFDDLVPQASSVTFDDLITDAKPKPAKPSIARDVASSMRHALGDRDYASARTAEPTIAVDDLAPQNTVREPGYTRLDPAEDIFGQPNMSPTHVPAAIETPSLTSNTGPDLVQVDARPALRAIDDLRANERGAAATALDTVRGLLFRNGGVDTSVVGLENARDGINGMIATARQGGDMHVVERLTRGREALDGALSSSPEFAQANRNFAAASEPLAPFTSPGMDKAIRRDEFSQNFATPAEDVPGLLSSPSEARNFNSVASPTAAGALEGNVTTRMLDAATDASGNIVPDRLAVALRENQDLLSQFPAARVRLETIVDRGRQLAAERHGPLADVAAATPTLLEMPSSRKT
jgi:hypothetical protein